MLCNAGGCAINGERGFRADAVGRPVDDVPCVPFDSSADGAHEYADQSDHRDIGRKRKDDFTLGHLLLRRKTRWAEVNTAGSSLCRGICKAE
jgi:hypothetical protein